MRIAYVRVSTAEQNEQRQIDALAKHDIERWFTEKVSGKDTNRPQLQAMLEFAEREIPSTSTISAAWPEALLTCLGSWSCSNTRRFIWSVIRRILIPPPRPGN